MFAGVKVAVDNAAFQFDKLYSYNLPQQLRPYARIGARVLVPFGKAGSRMGVVLDFCENDSRFKSVIDIERGEPVLNEELVQLVHYLKDTTFCTYYDAVKTVLPKNLRLVPNGDDTAVVQESEGHTEGVYTAAEGWQSEKVTPRQKQVLEYLAQPHTYAEIHADIGVTRETVNRLAEKGLVLRSRRQKESAELFSDDTVRADFALSAAQQAVFNTLCEAMDDAAKPDISLLHGVTSSGKTLLYISLIRRVVQQGRQVILLVPEIALATQMIGRLRAQFPNRVGIIHSALSDGERAIQWNNAREGKYDVVVGTRSAVFTPFQNIGLIILDEEQETAYNSDKAPRYRAAAVATMRARRHGAQLLLSSATPSVESYYRAVNGQYNLACLTERYGNMPLPEVTVADMREELIGGNSGAIGSELYAKLKQRLERGEQSILLLNRRGYRTVTICKECREVVMCEDCAMPMVWHKQDNTHRCHYCGKQQRAALSCPKCGGELRHTGIGTQRIEEELQLLFPEARILRVDLDSVSRKDSMVRALRAFERGEYDIMIGTQMIAKGLDFKNVTLAGVLNIDNMLLMPSYRAFERAFDMLTQVVGRSGRGDKVGEAVIQTVDPYNPIIRMAAAQDYVSFYQNEIVLRKAHLYPPFCAMGAVCFADAGEEKAKAAADAFAQLLRQHFSAHTDIPLRVLGPSPMRVAVMGGVHRWRILLKSRGDSAFRKVLAECLWAFSEQRRFSSTRVWADFTNDSEA